MTTRDPRATLATLMAAFERHLEAAGTRRGDNDPVVLTAYRDLVEAFEDYDEALLDAFDEVTPFEVFRDSDEEETQQGDRLTSDTGLDDHQYDSLDDDDEFR
ncbi:MAG: primosomal protein [Actinomycetota bacterium]